MSLDFATQSANFTGLPDQLLKGVDTFLKSFDNAIVTEKLLVHALIFPKTMEEADIRELNNKLGTIYRTHGFNVLGGDTSSGKELNVFISVITC